MPAVWRLLASVHRLGCRHTHTHTHTHTHAHTQRNPCCTCTSRVNNEKRCGMVGTVFCETSTVLNANMSDLKCCIIRVDFQDPEHVLMIDRKLTLLAEFINWHNSKTNFYINSIQKLASLTVLCSNLCRLKEITSNKYSVTGQLYTLPTTSCYKVHFDSDKLHTNHNSHATHKTTLTLCWSCLFPLAQKTVQHEDRSTLLYNTSTCFGGLYYKAFLEPDWQM